MKSQLGLILSLATVLALTACSKEVTVDGGELQFPGGPAAAKVDVTDHTFSSSYGDIRFAQVAQNTVQVFRTCSYSSSSCERMGAEVSTSYQLNLNDSNSVNTRALNGGTASTRATGSMTSLALTTDLINSSARVYETVTEVFSLSDDPCATGEGKGLEVKRTDSQPISGGSIDTETCIAYH